MKRVSTYIHLFPAALIVLGVIACFVSTSLTGARGDFAGILLLVSMATLLIGGMFGFLFGIPKLNKAYNPGEEYDRNTKYRPNTNLEDISDWLTKIIIGITLTQLIRIPGYFRDIVGNILTHVDCTGINCGFMQPLLISAILYFLIAGFIIGYFYTRLYLPNLFAIMEENRIKDAEIAIWRSGTRTEKGASLSLLSDEEREVLKMMKRHNHRLPSMNALETGTRAAVNVLVAKGILEWVPGKEPRKEWVPRIINQELLDELIDENIAN
mgnify:CR=1 FL=1